VAVLIFFKFYKEKYKRHTRLISFSSFQPQKLIWKLNTVVKYSSKPVEDPTATGAKRPFSGLDVFSMEGPKGKVVEITSHFSINKGLT